MRKVISTLFAMSMLSVMMIQSLNAAQVVTTTSAGAVTTLNDNCGFVVNGSVDGWIRLHLYNDTGDGRDLWVRHDTYYPLRVKDVIVYSSGSPDSITFDDSQQCGYTRSMQLDECSAPLPYNEGYIVNYGPGGVPLNTNIGFYTGGESGGQIEVKLRTDATSAWHIYSLTAGEFALGNVLDCRLVNGSSVTTLIAVAP